jgi:hypothetical protein
VSEPWRTTTVVALCEAMRQSRDYSAAPILADALEEAGYGYWLVLRRLRGQLQMWEAERLVALIYSDKTAAAVKRIEEIAEWMGPGVVEESGKYSEMFQMDYQRLMEAARRWLDDEEATTQWMGERWHDAFPERAREFWENYQIITGRKPPNDTASFFHCSC